MMRELFGGTTTGIEPYFSWEYWRASRLGTVKQTVDIALKYMEEHGLKDTSELPDHFVTAMELTPLEHVTVQATIQKWTDSSISKTVNAPNDFTIEETDELYLQAYKLGLKGITIYRDGSREAQVLATKEEDAKLETHIEAEKLKELKAKKEEGFMDVKNGIEISGNISKITINSDDVKAEYIIKKVPSRLFGMREKVHYQSGESMSKAYIHIYQDENGTPIEVWINPTNVEDKDMADALGRMITQFLRFGATRNNLEQAVKHLKKGKSMFSLPAIVGRLLEQVYYGKIEMPTFNKTEETPKKKEFEFQVCSECGEKAYDKPNCVCHACGHSKCN